MLKTPAIQSLIHRGACRSGVAKTFLIAGNMASKLASPTCHTTRPIQVIQRHFSDRLLGYSPMAPSLPNQTPTAPKVNEDGTPVARKIPTAQDVTTSGGVWAPTSAKRDKLGELRVALIEGKHKTLDDAATPEQRLDLYLADGIQLIAQTTDGVPLEDVENVRELQDLSEWLVREQGRQPEFIYDEPLFAAHMDVIIEKIARLLDSLPPQTCLNQVRDFLDPQEAIAEELPKLKESELTLQDSSFQMATLRFRLLLAKAATEHAKASWKLLTTMSDADVDRAAVKGEVVPPQAVALANLYKYIFAHASGTCADRVDAAWKLLDESEMNDAAFLCVTPVQMALKTLFQEALEASPVRKPLPPLLVGNATTAPSLEEKSPQGWRQRRQEKTIKKVLQKMFEKTTQNHFQDEVEINHRLRCIYAWAEKEHQNNKLDSVLIDEGWTGRKRYVELSPKISLSEFREVQQEHFTHLDRIGKEFLKSFREDLWVQQGKGRERAELIRDCLAFLTVVSIADYLILMS